MGNKQAKPAASAQPAAKTEPPPKVPPAEETVSKAEGSSSPDNSPSLPAYVPEKETDVQTAPVETETEELDTTPPTQEKSEEPETAAVVAETKTEEAPPVETVKVEEAPPEKVEVKHEEVEVPPEEVEVKPEEVEVEKEAAPKVEMPPLALEKIDQTPPEPAAETEEEDPDLMAPLLVLTDAMSSLKYPEETTVADIAKRSGEDSSEAVMLASPITHDEVSLDDPTPFNSPETKPPDRDDVSIDDEVSAADIDPSSHLDGIGEHAGEGLPFEQRGLGEVPEDTISLTSSAARGEDELLKNIMGVSTAYTTATSNESVRGSVAVSEMTFDETQWETVRRGESTFKGFGELPLLFSISLNVRVDQTVELVIHQEETPKAEADVKTSSSPIVTTVVDSIFENVLENAKRESEKQETVPEPETQPQVAPSVEPKIETVTPLVPETKPEPVVEVVTKPEPVVEQVQAEDVHLPESTEAKSVEVGGEEISGDAKASLTPEEEASLLKTYPSQVSDNQSSVELKTPFENISESQDLSGTLDIVPEATPQEAVETLEEAVSADPVLQQKKSVPEETGLFTSASGETRKAKKSRSRKKKTTKSEESSPAPTSGLQTSASDGTAAVDSPGLGAPKPKPKPQSGRSGRGRGRGRGRSSAR